jgi:hypothetical protein
MNHKIMAVVLISLGIVELAAGYLKIRYWIFLQGERRAEKELGEDVVFRRRKVAGIIGIVLGIVVFLYGNF